MGVGWVGGLESSVLAKRSLERKGKDKRGGRAMTRLG